MDTSSYSPPVDRLLKLGQPLSSQWPDYGEYGLQEEHVPELIRMAVDRDLHSADESSLEVWAPIHAWRALGQLRATAAAGPLLELLNYLAETDDDWGPQEIPAVLCMMGPTILPQLADFLANHANDTYARMSAGEALEQIAKQYPDARANCVGLMTCELERAEDNDPGLNGFLISSLIELRAVQSAPVIERAFGLECVDLSVTGDWERVRYDLGLGPKPDGPRRRFASLLPGWPTPRDRAAERRKERKRAKKAQRKQAARARTLNRKRLT